MGTRSSSDGTIHADLDQRHCYRTLRLSWYAFDPEAVERRYPTFRSYDAKYTIPPKGYSPSPALAENPI